MNSNLPKQGEIYRHYKGNLYQIVAIATHTETEEEMVVYQALYGEFKYFVRPLSMFMEKVKINGQNISRFELVTDNINNENIENVNIDNVNMNKTLKDRSIHINLNRDDILEIMEGSISDNKDALESNFEDTCNMMGFLDAKTYTEKMNILKEMHANNMLDEHILRNCAMSIDCVVDEDGIDEQYYSIMNCLNMLSKYECTRLR